MKFINNLSAQGVGFAKVASLLTIKKSKSTEEGDTLGFEDEQLEQLVVSHQDELYEAEDSQESIEEESQADFSAIASEETTTEIQATPSHAEAVEQDGAVYDTDAPIIDAQPAATQPVVPIVTTIDGLSRVPQRTTLAIPHRQELQPMLTRAHSSYRLRRSLDGVSFVQATS